MKIARLLSLSAGSVGTLVPTSRATMGVLLWMFLLWSAPGWASSYSLDGIDRAPAGSLPLLQARPGTTAIAGRVLGVDGTPLINVLVKVEEVQTTTDAKGRYLLAALRPGPSVIIVDGRHAVTVGGTTTDYGYYEIRETAEAGRTVALPYVNWLTPIDHAHDVRLEEPLLQDRAITTPDIPQLELRLPKGAVLTDPDGHAVRQIGLTKINIHRPPYPFPRYVHVPIYFTAQPGGSVISSADGSWLGAQIVYPNYWHAAPGARARFWRYQPDIDGWGPYGQGTVVKTAMQVAPDKDTRIYELTGAMLDNKMYPQDAPNCNCENQGAGDPVDLGSGVFTRTVTDLSVPDVLPIAITRTYQSDDYSTEAFGIGMNLSYDMYLVYAPGNSGTLEQVYLILPNGARILFQGSPGQPLVSTKPGQYFDAHLEYNGTGAGTTGLMVTRDGTSWTFNYVGALQSISDRFGNTISILRTYTGTGVCANFGCVTQVTSPNGRHLFVNWNGATSSYPNTIASVSDDAGRTVTYKYTTGTPTTTIVLASVTDADSLKTTYDFTANNQLQSITDPNGHIPFSNVYCPSGGCTTSTAPDPTGQVETQTLPDGSVYTYSYSIGPNGIGTETDVSATLANNSANNPVKSTAHFDATGLETTYDLAVGKAVEVDNTYCYYQDAGNPSTCPANSGSPAYAVADVIDNLTWYDTSGASHSGRDTHTAYDALGNVAAVTYLSGTSSAVTYNYTYSPSYSLLISAADPLGHTVTIQRPEPTETATTVTDANGNSTQFTYNAEGQPVTITDPLGRVTSIGYDSGDVASITVAYGDPLARTTKFYTDVIGRVIQATDPIGNISQWTYDPIYGVKTFTDPASEITTTTFDPVGNVSKISNANAGTAQGITSYTYNSSNQVTKRVDPDSNSDLFQLYDGYGDLLKATDRNGNVVTYTYDALGRISSATYKDGSVDTYTWDQGGRLDTIIETNGTTTKSVVNRTYDGLDRLTCESNDPGSIVSCPVSNTAYNSVAYTYDAADRLATRQVTNQSSVSYGFDDGNRIVDIKQGTAVTNYHYYSDNRVKTVTYPVDANGARLVASYVWDHAAELTSISYANAASSGSSTAIGNFTYAYDLDSRIVGRGGSGFEEAPIDAVTSVSYDPADRITSRAAGGSTATPVWDNNGNLVCDNGTGLWPNVTCNGRTFAWDSRNRLLSISPLGTDTSYTYDPLDRRLSKASTSGAATHFLYDGWDVAEEQNASGSPSTNLFIGLGIDDKLTRTEASTGATLSYIKDAQGSTIALANNGTVQTNYLYDPFGVTSVVGASDTNAYQFTGRELDATGLQYNRHRYYYPLIGRFISEDPIGLAGGINRYAYVGNDPVNWADPSGLFPLPSDPSGLPPGWSPDLTHRDPNGQRFRDPAGNSLDFHKGRPGLPGWRGKDHWHYNDCDKHLPPGADVPDAQSPPDPEPQPEPSAPSPNEFSPPPWLPLLFLPLLFGIPA